MQTLNIVNSEVIRLKNAVLNLLMMDERYEGHFEDCERNLFYGYMSEWGHKGIAFGCFKQAINEGMKIHPNGRKTWIAYRTAILYRTAMQRHEKRKVLKDELSFIRESQNWPNKFVVWQDGKRFLIKTRMNGEKGPRKPGRGGWR